MRRVTRRAWDVIAGLFRALSSGAYPRDGFALTASQVFDVEAALNGMVERLEAVEKKAEAIRRKVYRDAEREVNHPAIPAGNGQPAGEWQTGQPYRGET